MTEKPLLGLIREGEEKVIDVDVTDCFQSINLPDLTLDMKFEQKGAKAIKPPSKPKRNGRGKEGTFDF